MNPRDIPIGAAFRHTGKKGLFVRIDAREFPHLEGFEVLCISLRTFRLLWTPTDRGDTVELVDLENDDA